VAPTLAKETAGSGMIPPRALRRTMLIMFVIGFAISFVLTVAVKHSDQIHEVVNPIIGEPSR
jgi:preprotein translocase subunit SecG